MSVLYLLVFSWIPLKAQDEIADQQHSWYMLAASHKFSQHWGATTLFDWRREFLGETWQQSLLRVGLDYTLSQGPIISAGYDWLQNFPYGEQAALYAFNENRIFEQFTLKQPVGRVRITHRYRLEQRFLGKKTESEEGRYTSDGTVFRQRIRYRLSVEIPLTEKEMNKGGVFLLASDELFVNFGKGVGKNALDQNWFKGGVGYCTSDRSTVFVGYLNQYVLKGDGVHAERNHTLRLVFSTKIDWQQIGGSS
jgi:hypothetical protein